MAEKKFKVQLVYDKEEKKLVAVGNVHDKNGVPMKDLVAIPICDPDKIFPTALINNPSHAVVFADIIVHKPEKRKKGEITLLKGRR